MHKMSLKEKSVWSVICKMAGQINYNCDKLCVMYVVIVSFWINYGQPAVGFETN